MQHSLFLTCPLRIQASGLMTTQYRFSNLYNDNYQSSSRFQSISSKFSLAWTQKIPKDIPHSEEDPGGQLCSIRQRIKNFNPGNKAHLCGRQLSLSRRLTHSFLVLSHLLPWILYLDCKSRNHPFVQCFYRIWLKEVLVNNWVYDYYLCYFSR